MLLFLLAPTLAHADTIVGNDNTEPVVTLRRDLTQGGYTSPEMFAIYIDPLLRRVWLLQVALRHKTDVVTAFADDLKSHTSSVFFLALTLRLFAEWEIESKTKFSPAKCACLAGRLVPARATVSQCCVGGVPLSVFNKVTYLGESLSSSGLSHHGLISARYAAKTRVFLLHQLGLLYYGMPLEHALRLWKSFVRPLYDYAVALTQLNGATATAAARV